MNAVVLSIVGYTLQTKVTFDQRDSFFFFIRIYLSLPVYFDTDTSKVSRANPFPLDSRESGGEEGRGLKRGTRISFPSPIAPFFSILLPLYRAIKWDSV